MEITGNSGKILVLSRSAFNLLTKNKITTMAGLHLLRKKINSIFTQVEQGVAYDNC
jgi:hypothetical protein